MCVRVAPLFSASINPVTELPEMISIDVSGHHMESNRTHVKGLRELRMQQS